MPIGELLLERMRNLGKVASPVPGAVIYWMSREIRSEDNWALIYAQEKALEFLGGQPLYVVYNLEVAYLGGGLRQHVFKVNGLKVVAQNLEKLNIPFYVETAANFPKKLVQLAENVDCSLIVTDFTPLRLNQQWTEDVVAAIGNKPIAFHQVDAHNVVPTWVSSKKCEFGARTIRPKLHKLSPKFLVDYPHLKKHTFNDGPAKKKWSTEMSITIDQLLTDTTILKKLDSNVKPVTWLTPGEDAGKQMLIQFISQRLNGYQTGRNGAVTNQVSHLSPYFHYGMLSPQRAIFDVTHSSKGQHADRACFIEECFVRRELSDNFCFYNENYDNVKGFHAWAQKTICEHKSDEREYIYSLNEFESAKTRDDLWNAAQMEMVNTGKMHGYVRMYWGKKILEWTKSIEEALKFALYLNDKYELDGRDPNGYCGCAWSIGGVHDRAWTERPIYGKIRYMTHGACKRKFDLWEYIAKHLGENRADSAIALIKKKEKQKRATSSKNRKSSTKKRQKK